jgi:hypothetical protein
MGSWIRVAAGGATSRPCSPGFAGGTPPTSTPVLDAGWIHTTEAAVTVFERY